MQEPLVLKPRYSPVLERVISPGPRAGRKVRNELGNYEQADEVPSTDINLKFIDHKKWLRSGH